MSTALRSEHMPLPTTRYARFVYRQRRYARRYDKWRRKRERWIKVLGKTVFGGHYPMIALGPKQRPHTIVSNVHADVNPLPFEEFIADPWLYTLAAYRRPPRVKILNPLYLSFRNQGQHLYRSVLGFGPRRRKYVPLHVKPYRRTARERKITGANWRYFRTGYFPDWDILQRHPNETDAANGLPGGLTPWPVPLGY